MNLIDRYIRNRTTVTIESAHDLGRIDRIEVTLEREANRASFGNRMITSKEYAHVCTLELAWGNDGGLDRHHDDMDWYCNYKGKKILFKKPLLLSYDANVNFAGVIVTLRTKHITEFQ